PDIDHSEAEELESLCLELERAKVDIVLRSMNKEVRTMIERLGMEFLKEVELQP
ncbi:MAG: hypothetical protein HUK24_02750, partial [Sphaerochaetaceae bacterium]|nr:hypothetical protein [Sphaerochaetaceae bacterium]